SPSSPWWKVTEPRAISSAKSGEDTRSKLLIWSSPRGEQAFDQMAPEHAVAASDKVPPTGFLSRDAGRPVTTMARVGWLFGHTRPAIITYSFSRMSKKWVWLVILLFVAIAGVA